MSKHIELLRLAVIGSVDDGKSTLIGRMFLDSDSIKDDQLEELRKSSESRGDATTNLALFTDGLKAEREQGITIDVAYRYFSTPERKFIVADCPGHFQYNRNMFTGCTNVDVAVVIIDARNGITEQTKRHTFLASLLNVKHFILCLNKMDLVDYSEEVYRGIRDEFLEFVSRFSLSNLDIIPVSALQGDNIVNKTTQMPWYQGPALLNRLENLYIGTSHNYVEARFPVQRVIRPLSEEFHDFRGYAGQISGGVFKPGDDVTILPSGFTTKIKNIASYDEERIEEAFPTMSVVMTLEDEFDISRGDMIVKANNQPKVTQDVEAMLCWFSQQPLNLKKKYLIRHTTRFNRCIVKNIDYKVDIRDLHKSEDKTLSLNDIGRITLRTSQPLICDEYNKNKETGSFVLIDEQTNDTVAGGMILQC